MAEPDGGGSVKSPLLDEAQAAEAEKKIAENAKVRGSTAPMLQITHGMTGADGEQLTIEQLYAVQRIQAAFRGRKARREAQVAAVQAVAVWAAAEQALAVAPDRPEAALRRAEARLKYLLVHRVGDLRRNGVDLPGRVAHQNRPNLAQEEKQAGVPFREPVLQIREYSSLVGGLWVVHEIERHVQDPRAALRPLALIVDVQRHARAREQ